MNDQRDVPSGPSWRVGSGSGGVFNRFSRHFIHWLPYFAIIGCRGRKSGKWYRTPMNVFRDGESYVFALTYGSDVQWEQNVLAAGEADLQIRNETVHLASPELFVGGTRHLMPFPVRMVLGFARVNEIPALATGCVLETT